MEMPVFRIRHQFPNEIKRASSTKRTIVASKVKMTMIHEAFFTIFALLVACLDIGILIYDIKNCNRRVGIVNQCDKRNDCADRQRTVFPCINIQYKLNKTAWLRFVGLLDLKGDMQLQKGAAFDTFSKEIRIENLSFHYENKNICNMNSPQPKLIQISQDINSCEAFSGDCKKILHQINLTIKKGEKVAFVGESDSGKSTLVKVLIGLLKYKSGEILFDNRSLKDFSLESFYKKVSYLSQDTPVFDGTIRENLVFDKEVLDAEIHVSLEATQLLPMITSLDNGIDTRIGEKGTCLSGGEKQRLALARLWFDHAEIVVLDEATSALDNVTESIVMKNVLTQVKNATVIAIAHRLTFISGFDKIFVFKEGRIVGSGTFEELLATNNYFGELYRKEKECKI